MKIILFVITCLFFSAAVYATNPNIEIENTQSLPQKEINSILDNVLDVNESKFISQLEKETKVIIIDGNFNKIREAYIEKEQNSNNQRLLQPFIHRSQFITKVHNVSYYMLEKK